MDTQLTGKQSFPNLQQKVAWKTMPLTLSFFSALAACLQIGCQTSEPKRARKITDSDLSKLTVTRVPTLPQFDYMGTLHTHQSGGELYVLPFLASCCLGEPLVCQFDYTHTFSGFLNPPMPLSSHGILMNILTCYLGVSFSSSGLHSSLRSLHTYSLKSY